MIQAAVARAVRWVARGSLRFLTIMALALVAGGQAAPAAQVATPAVTPAAQALVQAVAPDDPPAAASCVNAPTVAGQATCADAAGADASAVHVVVPQAVVRQPALRRQPGSRAGASPPRRARLASPLGQRAPPAI